MNRAVSQPPSLSEAESLLSAINEDIALHLYDPHRPALSMAERQRLESLFPDAFGDIQHLGSTAVPGLTAEAVTDILAGVASMSAADALVEPLCRAGYTTSADVQRYALRSAMAHEVGGWGIEPTTCIWRRARRR